MIGVAQYEALLAYLNAPPDWVLPSNEGRVGSKHISVEAVPGQTVRITVLVAGDSLDAKGVEGDVDSGSDQPATANCGQEDR